MPLPPPTTAGPTLTLSKVRTGLLGSLFMVTFIVILVAFIGLLIASPWLPSPFFQIFELAGYGTVIALVADRLYDCFQVARTSEQKTNLKSITFLFVLIVLAALNRVVAVFGTEDRDYVRMATDVLPLFALNTALGMVATLLKASSPTVEGSQEGLPTVPILDLSQSPGGTLAFRLPVGSTPRVLGFEGLLGCTAQAVIWIGAAVASIVVIVARPAEWTGRFGAFPTWLAGSA